jgi:hypothetical protein
MATETKVMREFREAVLSGIAELKIEVINIVHRLDKVNGNIARQQGEIGSLQIADAKHESCSALLVDLKADVEKLKASTLQTDTKIALTEKYAGAIWATVGGSVILLFQKLPEILKLVEGK